MLPAAKRMAYIFQPAYSEPVRSELAKENEATAVVLGLEYQEFPVRHADEIAAAITDAVFAGCDSLLIEATDNFIESSEFDCLPCRSTAATSNLSSSRVRPCCEPRVLWRVTFGSFPSCRHLCRQASERGKPGRPSG